MRPVFSAALLFTAASLAMPAAARTPPAQTVEAIRLLYPKYMLGSASAKPGEYPESWGVLAHEITKGGASDDVLGAEPIFKKWNPAASAPLGIAAGAPSAYYLLLLPHGGVELGLSRLENGHLVSVSDLSYDPEPDIDPAQPEGAKLDLAPYRIAPQETAFGVRASSYLSTTSTTATAETLDLIRPTRNADGSIELVQIFHASVGSMEYDHTSGPIDRETGDRSGVVQEEKSTVTMSGHATRGFYDILVKTGKKSQRYVWNGHEYTLAKR